MHGDGLGSHEEHDGPNGDGQEDRETPLTRFYLGLRRDVSLLLSEGHEHAREYPVVHVWNEARIVRQRHSTRRFRDSALTQLILSTLFNKKAGKELQKLLKKVAESD
jgi:hypothetical protein